MAPDDAEMADNPMNPGATMHARDVLADKEEPLTPEQIAEAQAATARRDERSLAAASNLIAQRLSGRFAIFSDICEGSIVPDGSEEMSGYVVDEQGHMYTFWTDWDAEHGRAIFTTWEQITPDPLLARSQEYLDARAAVGLPPLVHAS